MPYRPGPNYSLNDPFLKQRLKEVIEENCISLVVETGLNDGQSLLEFSYMADYVMGIDIDQRCIDATNERMMINNRTNYALILGDSAEKLAALPMPSIAYNNLYFLDAHWDEDDDSSTPLLAEIKAIPRGKGVIVVHDIKVPSKDFGYDVLNIRGKPEDFTYDVIKEALTDWSPTHRVEYNEQAAGCYRGVAIVYPK